MSGRYVRGYANQSAATLELRSHHEELVRLFHMVGMNIDEKFLMELFMLMNCGVPVDVILDTFKEIEHRDIEYKDAKITKKIQSQNN